MTLFLLVRTIEHLEVVRSKKKKKKMIALNFSEESLPLNIMVKWLNIVDRIIIIFLKRPIVRR